MTSSRFWQRDDDGMRLAVALLLLAARAEWLDPWACGLLLLVLLDGLSSLAAPQLLTPTPTRRLPCALQTRLLEPTGSAPPARTTASSLPIGRARAVGLAPARRPRALASYAAADALAPASVWRLLLDHCSFDGCFNGWLWWLQFWFLVACFFLCATSGATHPATRRGCRAVAVSFGRAGDRARALLRRPRAGRMGHPGQRNRHARARPALRLAPPLCRCAVW